LDYFLLADHPGIGRTTQYKRVLSTDPMSLPQRTKRRNGRWSVTGCTAGRKKAFETRDLRAITGINIARNRGGFGKVKL